MAVVVEYQAWDSASYNWLDNTTSTSAPLQINDKLDAWVAAVNANASNTNKQITVRKDPTDSTSANFIGWVIELASSSSNSTFFTRFYSSTTTNCVLTLSPAWTDNGTNGGYGAATGGVSDTTIAFNTSGVLAEFSIATETADGQEFFCVGYRFAGSNTVSSDQILIFKDSNGEWAAYFYDNTGEVGCYYMPTHTTPQRNFSINLPTLASNGNGGYLAQFCMSSFSNTYTPTTGNEYTAVISAASPAIYYNETGGAEWGYGRWAQVSGSRTAVCMGYGPVWIVF